MDWTWSFDDVAVAAITLATAAGAVLSLALCATVSVWLLCCGACRRWAALPRPLRWLASPTGRAAAAAFVVLSWDGLYLNNGGINAFLLLLGAVLQAVLAVVCLVARRGAAARSHAGAALVWVAALVAMAAHSRFNLQLSSERADAVIAACRRFEGDFGRLPLSLDELVPRYLPRVPVASWTVFGAFSYETRTRPQLVFFHPWPILRIYAFETGEWSWDDTPLPFLPRSGDDGEEQGPATARARPSASEEGGVASGTRGLAVTRIVPGVGFCQPLAARARRPRVAQVPSPRGDCREQGGDVTPGTAVAREATSPFVTD
jgi:hypothetical protein